MNKTSTPKPIVALIYTRVSTARQATDGLGLNAQASAARNYAAAKGWDVDGLFMDAGVSGKTDALNRPGLQQLLDRLQKLRAEGFDPVVVVYSLSRLARRQRLLWSMIEQHDLSISSATEPFDTTTPTGKAMLGMLAVFAQLEADMCSERTKDALAEAKANGTKLGRRPVADLAPDTVKLVKELYKTGLSQMAVAQELMNRKVKTPMGKDKWHLRQVQICLESP